MNLRHAAARWVASPYVWLFVASFAIALVILQIARPRGMYAASPLTAWSGGVAGVWQSDTSQGSAASSVASVDAAVAGGSGTASTRVPPPGIEHADFAQIIEQAITAEDSAVRSGAIYALRQAPAAEALAALEQVLHTDSVTANRVLALQLLTELPESRTLRGSILRVLQNFSSDADSLVAGEARAARSRLIESATP
jgi:hypothetical protein